MLLKGVNPLEVSLHIVELLQLVAVILVPSLNFRILASLDMRHVQVLQLLVPLLSVGLHGTNLMSMLLVQIVNFLHVGFSFTYFLVELCFHILVSPLQVRQFNLQALVLLA